MTTTKNRQGGVGLDFTIAAIAAIGACCFIGTANIMGEPVMVPAPLPLCQDCTCKMLYAWKNTSDTYASGMQTQGLTPTKILTGLAIQAKMCPDPPKVCPNATLVDRYEYQNPATTCTDQPNSRLGMEADVTGAGTRVAIGLNHSTCIEQNANCPPIP